MVIGLSLVNIISFSKPFPYLKILIIILLSRKPVISIGCLLSKPEVLRVCDHGLYPYFTIEKRDKHTSIKKIQSTNKQQTNRKLLYCETN